MFLSGAQGVRASVVNGLWRATAERQQGCQGRVVYVKVRDDRLCMNTLQADGKSNLCPPPPRAIAADADAKLKKWDYGIRSFLSCSSESSEGELRIAVRDRYRFHGL